MADVVLVTGGAGFVGSHLLEALTAMPGLAITAWRRPRRGDRPPAPVRSWSDDSRIRWRDVDLLEREVVTEALAECRPTQVYHLAGVAGVHASWAQVVPTLEGNVRATDTLLRAIGDTGISPRVLIPGSALVYRPAPHAITEDHPLGPTSPYAVSKLAQEMVARQEADAGLDVVITRSFTHLGPGQDPSYAASSFAQQIARIETGALNPVIEVGFLGARRDLLDVRDTVRAYLALMQRGRASRTYNVCAGRAYPIAEVLDRLVALAQVSVRVETAADRLRPQDHPLLLGDPTRLRDDTGWEPTISLDRTLGDLLAYWRSVVA